MTLTPHFDLAECVFSSTAVRLGIDNTPPDDLMPNVAKAALGMEKVRAILGNQPIHIDSWYRCLSLNAAVGGAANSAHMQGYAVDFICPAFGTPLDIVKALVGASLAFDALIQEGLWCHASFDPQMRGEVLTAHFGPGGTTYTVGL